MVRVKIDSEWISSISNGLPTSGVEFARGVKRNVLGRAVDGLIRFDPKFAAHVFSAHREFFAAGRAFFDAECQHAERAVEKARQRDTE